MKLKLPDSSYNWTTLIGATIAIISLFMIIFLFAISFFFEQGGSYLGLIIYIVLPSFMILGLILIPIGMYYKSKKNKISKGEADRALPRIDLNDIKHRNAFMIFTVGTVVLLFISAVGSYEAFHYSESVEFCGTTCHAVMKPEFVAYQNSPHAKVACVACHVGSGADWFVKAKLSGLYQVYAVLADVYPRPIETPIKNLRPARETCEQCHWPEKFYSKKLKMQRHYLNDETSSEWDIGMVIKIGPDFGALGLSEGIHWHINPDVKVEYVSTDEKRQNIPWVRYTNLKTGKVTVYENQEEPLEKGMLDSLEVRTMDCMDCHNRPSHQYYPPAFFVNNAITAGNIPRELPEIKSLAMTILGEDFETEKEAMEYIKTEMNNFYEENYPEVFENNYKLVQKGITGLQNEFNKNIFPEMKVKWSAYPNNIGHVEFDGCFRCHFDNHVSEDNLVISKDCNKCHTISLQGNPSALEVASINQTLEFKHPVDIEDAWKDTKCIECHTGLNP
ncbi:MAG: cytochrome C [Ignavibacteria bacterium GWB2_35_6b]|nr:MAG: cytochrome C [Ignavibacteria bacterium GWB2_35_6b]